MDFLKQGAHEHAQEVTTPYVEMVTEDSLLATSAHVVARIRAIW
jgi:hypothetical protein